ncbi:MAG: hypothetical protein ACREAB_04605, partial [Blastocatellia bacterium]
WRGDDAGSEWRIWSLIHNGFLSRGAGEVGLAPAVLSLPVPPVTSRFRALAVSAASGAALLDTGKFPAVGTAISMVAITVGTWINYKTRVVYVRNILTHSDYDKEKWKGDCGSG